MVKKTAKQTGHTILEDYKIVDNSKEGSPGGRANVNVKGEKEELEKNAAKKKDE